MVRIAGEHAAQVLANLDVVGGRGLRHLARHVQTPLSVPVVARISVASGDRPPARSRSRPSDEEGCSRRRFCRLDRRSVHCRSHHSCSLPRLRLSGFGRPGRHRLRRGGVAKDGRAAPSLASSHFANLFVAGPGVHPSPCDRHARPLAERQPVPTVHARSGGSARNWSSVIPKRSVDWLSSSYQGRTRRCPASERSRQSLGEGDRPSDPHQLERTQPRIPLALLGPRRHGAPAARVEHLLRPRQTPGEDRHPTPVAYAVAQVGCDRVGELIGQRPQPQRIAPSHDQRLPRGGEEETRSGLRRN